MRPRQDEELDCHRLFVYGTLRRGFRLHQHLVRLGARFESEAKVAGELFDLGSYPGARPSTAGETWILGETFHLRDVAADLKVLDEVEGFIPGSPERSQFIRARAKASLRKGTIETVWIYWLARKDSSNLQRIPSGDYADALAKDKA